jgi:hypothetical protein
MISQLPHSLPMAASSRSSTPPKPSTTAGILSLSLSLSLSLDLPFNPSILYLALSHSLSSSLPDPQTLGFLCAVILGFGFSRTVIGIKCKDGIVMVDIVRCLLV